LEAIPYVDNLQQLPTGCGRRNRPPLYEVAIGV